MAQDADAFLAGLSLELYGAKATQEGQATVASFPHAWLPGLPAAL